jgi:ribonuclease HI
MPHRLRDADVWAKVDASGALIKDADGRVEIVYKPADGAKVYRAGARNLTALPGTPVELVIGERAPEKPKGGGSPVPAAPDNAIHVWTDGACTGNPGPAGLGVVIIDGKDHRELSEYLGQGTNNIAELMAILRGLEEVPDKQRPVITQVRLTTSNDGIRGVAEGKVDATYASLGTGLNEEANAQEPVRFLSIPNSEANGKILAKLGASVVKAEAATGIRGDTNIIGYPLHLLTSTKVNERTVAAVLKAWWDNHAELQTIHPLFKQFTKEVQAITNFTIPYHSGAVKFYRDAGVWTAKHDARTKEICG